jgi:hypothetical protein
MVNDKEQKNNFIIELQTQQVCHYKKNEKKLTEESMKRIFFVH